MIPKTFDEAAGMADLNDLQRLTLREGRALKARLADPSVRFILILADPEQDPPLTMATSVDPPSLTIILMHKLIEELKESQS